jgi:putative heme-binding domain-containing protein
VLGFIANQLDCSAGQGQSSGASQLSLLATQGVIRQPPKATDIAWHLVDPRDANQSLDDRARSYLHANCAMCHHPGGNAIVSFFLRRDLPFDMLNTNKGTGIGTFGIRDAKIIAPGDPYRSLLLYRMSKLGYARMPYIGSQVVDSEGVALVAQWIRSLASDSAAPVSSPLTSNSSELTALEQVASKTTARGDRESAIRTLLRSTESALALAGKLHQHSVPQEAFETAASLGSTATTSDVRGLFETFIPESKRRPTLGPNIDPQTILSRQGDRQRGKLIFFSDGARCRACHEIDDPSQSFGPTLQEINKKYARPAELLQHVLQPSLKIDDSFAAYAVLTNDGRAINGLLVEQNDQQIVIKTADKKLTKIARSSLAEMQKSTVSLMPDRVLSDLTAQEAADLFEYIRSLGQ